MVISLWTVTKGLAWLLGITLVLFSVAVTSSLWRYWSWYPKVWRAKVTVNGKLSQDSRLYADARQTAAVIGRREPEITESYFVWLGPANSPPFVWRCEDVGISYLPGIAFSNHVQFGQGCISGNIVLVDSAEKGLSMQNSSPKRDLRVEGRLIEFTADDGKRIRVEW